MKCKLKKQYIDYRKEFPSLEWEKWIKAEKQWGNTIHLLPYLSLLFFPKFSVRGSGTHQLGPQSFRGSQTSVWGASRLEAGKDGSIGGGPARERTRSPSSPPQHCRNKSKAVGPAKGPAAPLLVPSVSAAGQRQDDLLPSPRKVWQVL